MDECVLDVRIRAIPIFHNTGVDLGSDASRFRQAGTGLEEEGEGELVGKQPAAEHGGEIRDGQPSFSKAVGLGMGTDDGVE